MSKPDPDLNPPDPDPVPDTMPPQNTGTTFEGTGTSIVYVDPPATYESDDTKDPCSPITDSSHKGFQQPQDHNRCGQKITQETARGISVAGTTTPGSATIPQIATRIGSLGKYDIVTMGFSTDGIPLPGFKTLLQNTVESNGNTFHIAAANINRTAVNQTIGLANNGIIAAASGGRTTIQRCPDGSVADSIGPTPK